LIKNLRWANASVIGTSHLKAGTRKQDWLRSVQLKTALGKVSFSIVSDGAGSASMGGEGAALICYSVTQRIREHFKVSSDIPTDDQIWTWIDGARELINECAQKRNLQRREFSATLVALLVTPTDVLAFHIGDGSIVARNSEQQWVPLSWPETGEYASTTYFLIDDPAPKLRIARFKNEFNAFSLFSDGIENLALDFKMLSPHPPFFNSILRPLDETDKAGKITNLSSALANFLNTSKINDRTDDDKSLIIISTK
jgi:hypothetical protein